jgi:DNA-binding response OmpR family regulator
MGVYEREPGEIQNPAERDKKSINVLLVDDEEDFVNVISKRLRKRNINVTGVLSGTEAIRILRRKDFDTIVLDLKMEDMDGIEVLKVVKKMIPEIPVIMLTGHGSETASKEGIEYGAFDYLTKPYDLEMLVTKIIEAAKRGK